MGLLQFLGNIRDELVILKGNLSWRNSFHMETGKCLSVSDTYLAVPLYTYVISTSENCAAKKHSRYIVIFILISTGMWALLTSKLNL